MAKSKTYFDLLKACRQPGCPVCRVETASVKAFLDALLYEQVNDPAARERLRGSLGFCHEHAWLIADEMRGNALGLAIIYEDVLGEVLRQLEALPAPPAHLRLAHKPCPACEQRKASAHWAFSVLVEHAGDPELDAAFGEADGLCLPHLRLALEEFKDAALREKLLSLQGEKLRLLRADLGEFIRKNDYRFMDEAAGAERDAWRRAIGVVTGNKPGS